MVRFWYDVASMRRVVQHGDNPEAVMFVDKNALELHMEVELLQWTNAIHKYEAAPAATARTSCTDCGGPLGGQRWRCQPCQSAARAAIEAAAGGTVRPSMIARFREGK